jgi:two-component system, NarL family, sensor kinase
MRYLLLLLPLNLFGQYMTGLNKDSLKHVINTTPDDTAKALTYIWLGQQYEGNQPDTAAYFYEKAHALSERLHYARGIVYYINNYTGILNIQGRYNESLKLHEQAVALCRANHLDQLLIKSLFNIGVVYQYKQDYKAAADHYLKIMPQLEQSATPQTLELLYNNLAGLYNELEQPDKSLPYARKSFTLASKEQDTYMIGQSAVNLANALRNLGREKEAEGYLRKALQVSQQTDDIILRETVLINLADLFSNNRQPAEYMTFYYQAIPLADSLHDVSGQALLLHGMAAGYYWQKKFDSAFVYGQKSLQFSEANDQPELVAKSLHILADIAIARGDLDAGFRYRNAYDSAYNAANDPELKKHLQELETRYAVAQQRERILTQNLQLARQRTWLAWLVAAALGLLLFGCFGFWYYRYNLENTRLKSLLEGQQQERRRISQEMHDDIGSGLTSLLFLSRSLPAQEPVAGRLQQTAQHLVQQMNEIIWTMNHTQDTLDSLVAYMRLHTAEALDNANIDYHFEVGALPEKPVGQELRRNVYLVCKEAVHNIIRHAQASHVVITINVDEQLHIHIADDGHGLPLAFTGFGNGLRNMRERMASIGGQFDIHSGSEGTTVAVSVPV